MKDKKKLKREAWLKAKGIKLKSKKRQKQNQKEVINNGK